MERQIYAYKCKKCGQLHYPYRMVCKKCHTNELNEFDPIPLKLTGKLLTYTYMNSLPADLEGTKRGLGIVKLTNGIRITGQINIKQPKMGMRVVGKVEVVKAEEHDKHYGVIFYKKRTLLQGLMFYFFRWASWCRKIASKRRKDILVGS